MQPDGLHLAGEVSIRAPRAGGDYPDLLQFFDHEVSIRAPRAGGDGPGDIAPQLLEVSIRAPRAGGDRNRPDREAARPAFQSAPPVREATRSSAVRASGRSGFNPRPPCGRRP